MVLLLLVDLLAPTIRHAGDELAALIIGVTYAQGAMAALLIAMAPMEFVARMIIGTALLGFGVIGAAGLALEGPGASVAIVIGGALVAQWLFHLLLLQAFHNY